MADVGKRILDMLAEKQLRRQNGPGNLSLADTILQRNKLQTPKKPLKVKEIK